jgi:hypothetical protein
MKYVISWKPRAGGSVAENEAGLVRVLEIASRWTPRLAPQFTSSSCGSTAKVALRSWKATTRPISPRPFSSSPPSWSTRSTRSSTSMRRFGSREAVEFPKAIK